MTYESAPATRLLAVSCCCCGRPLLDAVSVQAGVGPVCREKFGYTESQGEPDWAEYERTGAAELGYVARQLTPRELVNALVRRVAIDPNAQTVPRDIVAIDALGFYTLASTLAERVRDATTVEITTEPDRWGGLLIVQAPYSEALTYELRAVRGRRWDAARKVNTVPVACGPALDAALRRALPGTTFVRRDGRLTMLGRV